MNKRYLRDLAACIFILLWICACRGILKTPSRAESAEPVIERQSRWEAAFERVSGWTGGDVASSFIIPGNRVLWVFGDSWAGEVEDNRHVRAALVNNSIAVHSYDPARPGRAPAREEISFYFGPEDEFGKPAAWVRPAGVDSKRWYWPTGGGAMLSGPEGGWRLALFLILLEKKRGDDSVFGFECVGSAAAVIENAEASAGEWKPRVIELPHRIVLGRGEASRSREVDWGVAALSETEAGYVFIYGTALEEAGQRDLILARVGAEFFEDFGEWEFFSGDGHWSMAAGESAAVVSDVASELSVDELEARTGGPAYVMVYSEPRLGSRILVRSAARPEGPWSEAKAVFQVPDIENSRTLFTYAGKGHGGLSARGTLLISYIVNSRDFGELAGDASIYRPRFISLPLAGFGIQ